MKSCVLGGSALMCLCLISGAISVNKSIATSRGFLLYRTISIVQRSCNCLMSFSCSCCQSVIILYTKREKNLCVNFTYQRNGLNVDVALNSNPINTRTVTNYKVSQFCVFVPGCLFSTACVDIVELNRFPRSIKVCLRLDIYAKKKLWQINYNCISLSTELPMMPANTTGINNMPRVGMSTTENEQTGKSSIMESTTIEPVTEMLSMMGMTTSQMLTPETSIMMPAGIAVNADRMISEQDQMVVD